MRSFPIFLVFVLLLGLMLGCEPESPPPAPPVKTAPTPLSLPPPPPSLPAPPENIAQPPPPSESQAPPPPTPGPGMVREKADVGSGAKGHGYGEGLIATPAAEYWAARERIMFTIQIPEFLRAYKFEHDFKGPKSDAEFQKEIIQKYHVSLPKLPEGRRYFYDPATEQLMIERPR